MYLLRGHVFPFLGCFTVFAEEYTLIIIEKHFHLDLPMNHNEINKNGLKLDWPHSIVYVPHQNQETETWWLSCLLFTFCHIPYLFSSFLIRPFVCLFNCYICSIPGLLYVTVLYECNTLNCILNDIPIPLLKLFCIFVNRCKLLQNQTEPVLDLHYLFQDEARDALKKILSAIKKGIIVLNTFITN